MSISDPSTREAPWTWTPIRAGGRFSLCLAGYKGWRFLEGLLKTPLRPASVYTYTMTGPEQIFAERIRQACRESGIPVHERDALEAGALEGLALVVTVGWQYLLPPMPQLVVFHDSLLPRLRGFAPTATALLSGESQLGVTALLARQQPDTGPILGRKSCSIRYPLRFAQALDLQVGNMLALFDELFGSTDASSLPLEGQCDADASYSLWRDEADQQINWDQSAETIARFVDALSWPISGAWTTLEGDRVVVDKVETVDDRNFAIRDPGKIWRLVDGMPEVVCGTGVVRILALHDTKGNPIDPGHKLRRRFI